jgi:hypothetical protein
VYANILAQAEAHKEFQNEVASQRENVLSLEKKGSHLKHFAQKQDVILIKNLLTRCPFYPFSISSEKFKFLDIFLSCQLGQISIQTIQKNMTSLLNSH